MPKIIIAISVLVLSGCSSIVHSYGQIVGKQDPCQFTGKSSDYQLPNWCSRTSYRATVVDKQGHTVGYIK